MLLLMAIVPPCASIIFLQRARPRPSSESEKFAIQNNFSRSRYWNTEQGKVNLTLKTLVRILNSLDTKVEAFFENLSSI